MRFRLTILKAVLLAMVSVGMLHSEKIVPDLFPLAVGNSWTLALRTGGTQEYFIAFKSKDSLICISQTNSSGFSYCDTFPLFSYDSLGHFNFPYYRDLTHQIWGPHCAVARDGPITTPAGKFPETCLYPVTWGHPSGGNRSFFASPGVGIVAIAWTGSICETPPCLEDTFALLRSYTVVPKPEATWHDTIPLIPGNASFAFSYLKGDSGRASFKMTQSACARFMISSSYSDVAKVLRIYFVDTAGIECHSTITVYHALKVHNLEKDSVYTVAIYSAFFDTAVDIYRDKKYTLKTARKYFERITCASVSITTDRNKIPAKAPKILGVYDISGKLLFKCLQEFSGGQRLPSRMSSGVHIVKNDRGITVIPSMMIRK